jgi:shikimate kinase
MNPGVTTHMKAKLTMTTETGNIVLIGMPGVGKSTVGVLLAKATSRRFVDTDVVIQSRQRRRLQDLIDSAGLEMFRAVEEQCVCSLDVQDAVIATGGSVVYSDAAMRRLGEIGTIIHLDLDLPALEQRLNLDSRGVVMRPCQALEDLYAERDPLYRRYARASVNCEGLTHEGVVAAVLNTLEDPGDRS